MSTKNILVITYWDAESALIKTYTLPYLQIINKNLPIGSKIYLFTLSTKKKSTNQDYINFKKKLLERNIHLINFNYRPFGIIMFLKFIYIFLYLIFFTFKNNISFIHTWCTPAGAIGYIISLFTGVPIILDSFEPHAESMVETNTWKKNGVLFKILFLFEKLQLKKAIHVICATNGMIDYSQKKYGIIKNNYFVKPACVDLNLFKSINKDYKLVKGIDEHSIVCVYAGKFGGIYLEKEVFDFFKVAHQKLGLNFKVLLLTNETDEVIFNYCKRAQLDELIIIKKFVDHQDVPKYMALGDFGICPVKPVPTKQYCTPIKNGEYWALGLPVIISKNISDDSNIITSNNIGYELQDLTTIEYQKAIQTIIPLIKNANVKTKIRSTAEKYRNFEIADSIYKTIYA